MRRTTITLPEDMAVALAREARRRAVSASQVIREALAGHLGLGADAPRDLPFAGLGRSGQRTTARDMEELIRSEWHDARDR